MFGLGWSRDGPATVKEVRAVVRKMVAEAHGPNDHVVFVTSSHGSTQSFTHICAKGEGWKKRKENNNNNRSGALFVGMVMETAIFVQSSSISPEKKGRRQMGSIFKKLT